jgi:S1-C subfamily serine protease
VVCIVALIVVGLVVAVVLVVRDRPSALRQPAGKPPASPQPVTSTASTSPAGTPTGTPTAETPTAGTSPSPSPANTAAPAIDLAAVAASVDPVVVNITVKRASGAVGAGTGIVLTSNGEVMTNDHVIEGGVSFLCTIAGAGVTRTFTATVLGDDDSHDIALLQLQGASGLQTPVFGTTATVSVAEVVVATGHAPAAGAAPALVPGIVLALDQTIPAVDPDAVSKTLTGLIQIYTSIQPADTGGPVVNAAGEVIGVDVAPTIVPTQSGLPAAYAIPITAALQSAEQIRQGKTR